MKTGRIVWLDGRRNPFVIEVAHCLNWECACESATLYLREIALHGEPLADPIRFKVILHLREKLEHEAPERPPLIDALARQLVAELPDAWVDEFIADQEALRVMERRLAEHKLSPTSAGTLVKYSEIIHPDEGLSKGKFHYSFFFSCRDGDFLIVDSYCPTPGCDCQRVHFEFFEQIYDPEHHTQETIERRFMAAFSLSGELDEIEFDNEKSPRTRAVLDAWSVRVQEMRTELEERYEQVKAIGRRSGLPRASSSPSDLYPFESAGLANRRRTNRNDPCPCGSGKKFKRCCARQLGNV